MTTPELNNPPLATPEQASEMLREIGTLTTLKGERFNDRYAFGTTISEMPSTVEAHLPQAEETSHTVEDSTYITQELDRTTGRPRQEGVVAMVRFIRSEHVDASLIYQTCVIYKVTAHDKGNTYGIERHITSNEAGAHTAAQMNALLGRAAVDLQGVATDMLAQITNTISGMRTWQPTEKAAGFNDVTESEAQEVIEHVKSLNAL